MNAGPEVDFLFNFPAVDSPRNSAGRRCGDVRIQTPMRVVRVTYALGNALRCLLTSASQHLNLTTKQPNWCAKDLPAVRHHKEQVCVIRALPRSSASQLSLR